LYRYTENDRLVTVLEETAAAMGKKPDPGLFAAAMGKGNAQNDAAVIAAGWIPFTPRKVGGCTKLVAYS
jgi:hypothetical protein